MKIKMSESKLAALLRKKIALSEEREYVANILHIGGGTETFVIMAKSAQDATDKLLALGYARVNWVLPS